MSTKELQDAFPGQDASARAVKAWIRQALAFRDVDESQMDWVENCIWIGIDLYHVRRKDIEEGLYDFAAPEETARVLSRDFEQAKTSRMNASSIFTAQVVAIGVLLVLLFAFVAEETQNLGVAAFATAFIAVGIYWFWPEESLTDTIMTWIGCNAPAAPYSPRKPRKRGTNMGSDPKTKVNSFYQQNPGRFGAGW